MDNTYCPHRIRYYSNMAGQLPKKCVLIGKYVESSLVHKPMYIFIECGEFYIRSNCYAFMSSLAYGVV